MISDLENLWKDNSLNGNYNPIIGPYQSLLKSINKHAGSLQFHLTLL